MASMKESEKTPLASLYGAVQGLAELGPEVVKVSKLTPSRSALYIGALNIVVRELT